MQKCAAVERNGDFSAVARALTQPVLLRFPMVEREGIEMGIGESGLPLAIGNVAKHGFNEDHRTLAFVRSECERRILTLRIS